MGVIEDLPFSVEPALGLPRLETMGVGSVECFGSVRHGNRA
jgi:hypothetical protein